MNNDPIILLTASINPDGMVDTLLQDANVRMAQYLTAIEYYLNNTSLKIVFCENTNVNIYKDIKHPNKFERLEYIYFNGNKKKNFGKSFGELEIILYAINNSNFICHNSVIIKITGRVIINNINKLINSLELNNDFPFTYIELPHRFYTNTVCFAMHTHLLQTCIIKYGRLIEEKNFDFEKLMFNFLIDNKEIVIKEWYPFIIGICGTYNKPYKNGYFILRKLLHSNSYIILNYIRIKDERLSFMKLILQLYYNFSVIIRYLLIQCLKILN